MQKNLRVCAPNEGKSWFVTGSAVSPAIWRTRIHRFCPSAPGDAWPELATLHKQKEMNKRDFSG